MLAKRKGTVRVGLVLAGGLVLGSVVSAHGHNPPDTWYDATWNGSNANDDRRVEYYLDSGDNWPTGHVTAVEVSDAKWSDIDPTDGFTFVRQAGFDDWDTCFGIDRDNVVSKDNLDQEWYGQTTRCQSISTNMERFHIRLNTTDYSFYWGSGSAYPDDEVHARGVLTHEFGHASGWDGSHWNQSGYPNLCEHDSSVPFHTMCSSVNKQRSWKWATLEAHDEHTFENAYP
jgi:hypothetical protein